jgi:hypothetical protein
VRPIERFFGKALTIDAPTVERISPLRMHDLMRLMQALELPVTAYSVLKPLPAFQEL